MALLRHSLLLSPLQMEAEGSCGQDAVPHSLLPSADSSVLNAETESATCHKPGGSHLDGVSIELLFPFYNSTSEKGFSASLVCFLKLLPPAENPVSFQLWVLNARSYF